MENNNFRGYSLKSDKDIRDITILLGNNNLTANDAMSILKSCLSSLISVKKKINEEIMRLDIEMNNIVNN